ncbi:MAG: hypothetical protein K8W52_07935 [Deltaproteobacteria bacterium]|nr:hypothetical protein [Deltaproteobacteria bacterium]
MLHRSRGGFGIKLVGALAFVGSALVACGGGGTSGPPDAPVQVDAAPGIDSAPPTPDAAPDAAPPPDATPMSTVALTVPAGYSGTARQLDVVAVKHVPVAGPPDSILFLENNPVITAGGTISPALDTSALDGDFYVVVVLYQVGGGTFTPKSGVDYVAQTATAIHFTSGQVQDLGTLPLVLAP